MPWLDPAWRAYREYRWRRWFRPEFERAGIAARTLAKQYFEVPFWSSKKGAVTKTHINSDVIAKWINGAMHVPDASTAYRIGEALRLLTPDDATASGPIAMHAAGHCKETLQLLRTLAHTPAGARNAVVLYCLLPKVNGWLDFGRTDRAYGVFYDSPEYAAYGSEGAKHIDAADCRLGEKPEESEEKFSRYQKAFEEMTLGKELRSGPSGLYLADSVASVQVEVLDVYYERFGDNFEGAMLECWIAMLRWAFLAEPSVIDSLADDLRVYFLSATTRDPGGHFIHKEDLPEWDVLRLLNF